VLVELVAVAAGYLADKSMGTQQAQLSADTGRESAVMGGRRVRMGGVEPAAQVAIAKAGGGKFAARDSGKQGQVVRVADAQRVPGGHDS
jgi:hypothetical protein